MGVAEDYDSLKKYNIQSIFEAAQKEEGTSSAPAPKAVKAVSEDKAKEEETETSASASAEQTPDEAKSE